MTPFDTVLGCAREIINDPELLDALASATEETRLAHLGLDSLGAVELVALVELRADVKMPSAAFDMPTTVGEVVGYLASVQEGAPAT